MAPFAPPQLAMDAAQAAAFMQEFQKMKKQIEYLEEEKERVKTAKIVVADKSWIAARP